MPPATIDVPLQHEIVLYTAMTAAALSGDGVSDELILALLDWQRDRHYVIALEELFTVESRQGSIAPA